MKQIIAFSVLAGVFFIVQPLAVSAQTNSDAALLAQRISDIAGTGAGVAVTIGALPPGFKSLVPLPADLPILGSTRNSRLSSVTVYYQPDNANTAYAAYVAQLKAAGFALAEFPITLGSVGFTASSSTGVPRTTIFCQGTRGVSIIVPPVSTNDLRVTPTEAPLGPCQNTIQANGLITPLPALIAPPGTTMSPSGGSGGTAFPLPVTSFGGNIIFGGNSRESHRSAILQSFATQLHRAGWQVSNAVTGRDSGLLTIATNRNGVPWRGSLAVYRLSKQNAYMARIDASGGLLATRDLGASPAPLPHIPLRVTSANQPAMLELLARVAGANGGAEQAQVYLSQTPPGFTTSVPLPEATPLGSTASVPRYDPITTNYDVYYTLSNSQLQAYYARLQADGWTRQQFPGSRMGGFQNQLFFASPTFCKTGAGTVSIGASAQSSAVTVAFRPQAAGVPSTCSGDQIAMLESFPRSPLPSLTAPDGVRMRTASAGLPGGTSGASFVTAMPLAQLLDSFTSQLTKAGWNAGVASLGDSIGSRSYSLTDSAGKRWQAILTIYRSDVQSDRYYAFVDVTNVSAEAIP